MVDISKISNRVAARRLSYDFDYFDVREEKPWRYAEVDPYDWAIMKLREPLSRWTEFPSKKLKNQIIETWQEFHPELKQAIHDANRRALKDPVVWRVEPKGSFPTDLGGYSVHDTLEPDRISVFVKNPDAPIDEWGPVSDEVRGYKITPDDILIHWDTPDNPLDNPRWGWEREIILKPDASPRRLSETEKKKEMKRIHHHHHH